MNESKISICIPTYERTDMVIRAIEQVIGDKRTNDIVVVDDASNINTYYMLELKLKELEEKSKVKKIRLERNTVNFDCYKNKSKAISLAKNEYAILFDSDNVLTKDYIDVLYHVQFYQGWDKTTIYTPEFARPAFDFRWLSGTLLDKSNIARYIDQSNCETMLNAANYFVNRDEYLKAFDGTVDPVTSDSIYLASRWLERENTIYVTPKLQYDHTLHDGSHYRQNNKRTPQGFHEEVKKKLREMI